MKFNPIEYRMAKRAEAMQSKDAKEREGQDIASLSRHAGWLAMRRSIEARIGACYSQMETCRPEDLGPLQGAVLELRDILDKVDHAVDAQDD